jgi:hypothetical protein
MKWNNSATVASSDVRSIGMASFPDAASLIDGFDVALINEMLT